MPKEKLTPTERRELTLSALSGVPAIQLAREFGVARSWVYALVEEAKTDHVAKREEAEQELAFRKKVSEILENRPQNT